MKIVYCMQVKTRLFVIIHSKKNFILYTGLCWLEAISALLCGSCILLDYPYVKQRWPLTHQQQTSHRHHSIIMWTEKRSQKVHFNVILFEVAGFVWHLYRIISKRLNEGAIFQPQSVCAYMFMYIPKHECIRTYELWVKSYSFLEAAAQRRIL